MTINYVHTSEIIPSVIKGNQELFINEIFPVEILLKNFIEKDTYIKACDKLNISAIYDFQAKEIKEEKYDGGILKYVEFFDNYLMDKKDSKGIILAVNKGKIRYFRVDFQNYLYEIDLNNLTEEEIAKFDMFASEEVISYVLKLLVSIVKVPVGISARHVHLNKEDFEILFGPSFELEFDYALSQKGQFASKQRVTIKTDAGLIENVRILGPIRSYTQVEISKTDSYKLKLNPPVRDSGDLFGSEKITIIGPQGEVKKEYGCILANRHIHLTKEDLKKYNLDSRKIYKVKVKGEKGGILDNIHLKVDESFTFELHIDVDDANAFLINNGDELEIIK